MVNAVTALLLAAMIVPLTAAVGTFVLGRTRWQHFGRWPTVIGGCLLMIVAVALTAIVSNFNLLPQNSAQYVLFDWMSFSGMNSFASRFVLRVDTLSGFMLSSACLTAAAIICFAAFGPAGQRRSAGFFTLLSFALLFNTMLLLAGDLLQFFMFWKLATVCSFLLCRNDADSTGGGRCGKTLWLLHEVADIGVACGLFLIWRDFGTFNLDVVLRSSQIIDVLNSNPAATEGICFCLLIGAVGRCAQIPLTGWIRDTSQAPVPVSALLQTVTLFPAGVYLIARCRPLFQQAPYMQSLLLFLGGLTALLMAATALAQHDWRRTWGYHTAATAGLALLGLGVGSTPTMYAALFLTVCQAPAKALAILALGSPTATSTTESSATTDARLGGGTSWHGINVNAKWALLIAALTMTTGLWGQEAVLSSAWDAIAQQAVEAGGELAADMSAAGGQTATELAGTKSAASSLRMRAIWWMVAFSIPLLTMAVFRIVFAVWHFAAITNQADFAGPGSVPHTRMQRVVLWGLAMLGVLAGPIWGRPTQLMVEILPRTIAEPISAQSSPLFLPGITLPLMVLGVVAAWMSFTKAKRNGGMTAGMPNAISTAEDKAAVKKSDPLQSSAVDTTQTSVLQQALAPLIRLSQHGFYFEEFGMLFVVKPLHACGRIVRGIDRIVDDGLVAKGIARVPVWLSGLGGGCERMGSRFSVLAASTTLGVLLFVLLWLRRG